MHTAVSRMCLWGFLAHLFGGIFAAESPPSLTGVSWSLCLGHWGITASEHSSVLCWILPPRLCNGM